MTKGGARTPPFSVCRHGRHDGAGDGVRTRDPELGKLVLYQLSYTHSAVRVSADTGLAKTLFCYFLFASYAPKLLP